MMVLYSGHQLNVVNYDYSVENGVWDGSSWAGKAKPGKIYF